MSWSINYDSLEDFDNNKPSFSSLPEEKTVEMESAITVAQIAAKVIIRSGAVGSGNFAVYLSGHTNPNNRPQDGWGNDCITVSVTQKV